MTVLLTRTEFRESVFERDGHRCVGCSKTAADAHHIMERRLFQGPDEFGGYFIDNGASLCPDCHLDAEQTVVSCEEIRNAAKIKRVILASHLYADERYDKWGNIILPNGQRLKGELFHDESVQIALRPALHLFTNHVKYPRTLHLPWSLGMNDDDRMHNGTDQWWGKRVIVTLKMDGENTTMYRDHIHARSVDSSNHPSRNWVKNYWSQIAHEIPTDWRVCGENLYAEHSIHYDELPSYFLGFSVWDGRNSCLNWGETVEFFELLGIPTVPVIYDGPFDEGALKQITLDHKHQEGYVLRTFGGFTYGEFRKYVGKFVRPNHVQTTKHWMRGQPIVPNTLKK